MKYITMLAFGILLVSATSAYAQVWQEIKPIESTCKDVARLLGGKPCDSAEIKYELPTVNIYISIAKTGCDKSGWGYNVPAGTVIGVRAFLSLSHVFISDLHIDESKLKPGDAGDMLDILVWESDELGVKLETSKEKQVITASYYPAAKYNHLFCTPPSKSPPIHNR
ncbi:MAG: hypothetical protein QOE33_305 [Acidobacteriota bacterium]|nr:hypothetical protein [Acidobacteriota bacterium]